MNGSGVGVGIIEGRVVVAEEPVEEISSQVNEIGCCNYMEHQLHIKGVH